MKGRNRMIGHAKVHRSQARMDIIKSKFSVQGREQWKPENLTFPRIVGGKIFC